MRNLFSRTLIALVSLTVTTALAEDPKAIHQPQHLEALSVYKKNADDYVAKNLNRFGRNQLMNYDAAIDTMYKTEMNDTIAAFKSNYDKSHLSRSTAITSLNRQISELT